jgi:diphthamide synthase (EF-2-diphthine--ammonia ligase)
LRQQGEYEVVGLLTTFNRVANRVAMHGVRRDLAQAQARASEAPLWEIDLPSPCSNADYESIMREVCKEAVQAGIEYVAFGDLFLRDIREYREKQLKGSGLKPIFPVWEIPTQDLASRMINAGLKAKLSCIDSKHLSADFAGREFNNTLLADLPAGIDPCGENGEFHSFVYAGPMFRQDIPVQVGEIVARDGFVFADLKLSTYPTPG